MIDSSSKRMGIVAFLAILTVSSTTMLWLLWRFPLMTAIVTVAVIGGAVVLGRLASSIDVDLNELDRREQII